MSFRKTSKRIKEEIENRCEINDHELGERTVHSHNVFITRSHACFTDIESVSSELMCSNTRRVAFYLRAQTHISSSKKNTMFMQIRFAERQRAQ